MVRRVHKGPGRGILQEGCRRTSWRQVDRCVFLVEECEELAAAAAVVALGRSRTVVVVAVAAAVEPVERLQ